MSTKNICFSLFAFVLALVVATLLTSLVFGKEVYLHTVDLVWDHLPHLLESLPWDLLWPVEAWRQERRIAPPEAVKVVEADPPAGQG